MFYNSNIVTLKQGCQKNEKPNLIISSFKKDQKARLTKEIYKNTKTKFLNFYESFSFGPKAPINKTK